MQKLIPLFALALTACGTTNVPREAAEGKLTQAPFGGASGVIPDDPNVPVSSPIDLLTGAPGGAGSASSVGTVQSVAFAPVAAFFDALGKETSQATHPVLGVILLSDRADTCATLLNNQLTGNATNLTFVLQPSLSPSALADTLALSYPVLDPNAAPTTPRGALASLVHADAACAPIVQAAGTTGQVRLEAINLAAPANASGQFNVALGTHAENLTGAFNAAPCPGLAALVAAQFGGQSATMPTCRP